MDLKEILDKNNDELQMKINNFFLRQLIKVSIQFEKESFFFYLQSMTNNKNKNEMASRHIIKILIQFK